MAEELKPIGEALTEAVSNAVNLVFAERGMMLTGFVGQVDYLDEMGNRCWTLITPEEQFTDVTMQQARHLYRYHYELEGINIRAMVGNGGPDATDADD